MPKRLMPRSWPHFMEKKHKASYISEKILGQLYDKVQSVDFVPQYEAPFDTRILNAYPSNKDTLKAARQLKTKYDTAVRRIMAQHEINSEFEIWTTFVLSKPRVGSDYKTQETMGIIAGALKERFKDACQLAASGKEDDHPDFRELAPFVAAMYRVTHEEIQIALHECRTTITVGGKEVPKRKMEPKYMPLISFPWLFPEVLGMIATGVKDHEELVDLGLPFLTAKGKSRGSRKTSGQTIIDDSDGEDYIETAEGVTHRGEFLDLFRPDDLDSEGDHVEQPHASLQTEEDVHTAEQSLSPNNPEDFSNGKNILEQLSGMMDSRASTLEQVDLFSAPLVSSENRDAKKNSKSFLDDLADLDFYVKEPAPTYVIPKEFSIPKSAKGLPTLESSGCQKSHHELLPNPACEAENIPPALLSNMDDSIYAGLEHLEFTSAPELKAPPPSPASSSLIINFGEPNAPSAASESSKLSSEDSVSAADVLQRQLFPIPPSQPETVESLCSTNMSVGEYLPTTNKEGIVSPIMEADHNELQPNREKLILPAHASSRTPSRIKKEGFLSLSTAKYPSTINSPNDNQPPAAEKSAPKQPFHDSSAEQSPIEEEVVILLPAEHETDFEKLTKLLRS
jgi:hypothetical protein